MGWKDLFFEKVEVNDNQPQKQNPVPGGTGNTTFSRRLPSLSDNIKPSTPSHSDLDMSFLPSVTKKSDPSRGDQSKLHSHFDQVMASAVVPVPNYFTFSQMLNEMGDELPDTPKYKGAFSALRAQGLSKQALLESARSYIILLDQDNAGFEKEAMDTQKDSKNKIEAVKNLVENNNTAMEKVKKDVELQIRQLEEARDIRIRQLQKEIDDNKAKVAPLEEEAAKISGRIKSFSDACTDYKNMINSDIQKIQTIIPEK